MKVVRLLAMGSAIALAVIFLVRYGLDRSIAAYNSGNYQTAYSGLFPLAKIGNASAQYFLGQMFWNGTGVPLDKNEALKWLWLASDKGLSEAQTFLGKKYELGDIGSPDFVYAFHLYELAAKQGNVTAQASIASFYRDSKGMPKESVNIKLAYMWYNIASANGFKDGGRLRDLIARNFTEEEINELQSMATKCMNTNYKNCGH